MSNSTLPLRTFDQFIKHACKCYNLDFVSAKNIILEKLARVRLSPIAVVAYINWADNGLLTEQQIADCLGITQQGVQDHIQRLRKVWPHLPGKPKKYVGNMPLAISTDMVRLTPDIINNTKKLKVWGIYHFTDTEDAE